MAVLQTTKNNRVSLKLNNGTSETGAIITISLALSGLKKTAWNAEDNTRAMNIVNAARAVLGYAVYRVERSETFDLDEE